MEVVRRGCRWRRLIKDSGTVTAIQKTCSTFVSGNLLYCTMQCQTLRALNDGPGHIDGVTPTNACGHLLSRSLQ